MPIEEKSVSAGEGGQEVKMQNPEKEHKHTSKEHFQITET